MAEEIANKFIEFYKSNDPFKKYELYSNDCVSIESPHDGNRFEVHGLDLIKKRHLEFYGQFSEIHNKFISSPLIADYGFSLVINFDVQKDNHRITFKELCVFEVRNGKIIKQEFIY